MKNKKIEVNYKYLEELGIKKYAVIYDILVFPEEPTVIN